MICEYCQHDHGELHECDIDDLKENIDMLVGDAADYVAIIAHQSEAQNGKKVH